MTKHSIAVICALSVAAFGFAPRSIAEDAAAPTVPALTGSASDDGKDVKETKEVKEQIKQSCITGDLGVTFVSEYISRGIILENQGVIAQPYLDLYFKLYEGTGFINKVSLNLGLWTSIHSHVEPFAVNSSVRNWYEFDWTPGIAVTMAKNLTATLSYFEFDSPLNAPGYSARSINLNLAYDDTDLLGKFALHPHVTVLAELDAPGAAGINGHGWYFEPGIAPSYTLGPVTFTAPITLGLGDHRFYNGPAFGYVSAGIQASIPISFIPDCFGKWTLSGGYTYYYLCDQLCFANVAQGNNGHNNQSVLQGAIGLTF
jgi:hypothetical protein